MESSRPCKVRVGPGSRTPAASDHCRPRYLAINAGTTANYTILCSGAKCPANGSKETAAQALATFGINIAAMLRPSNHRARWAPEQRPESVVRSQFTFLGGQRTSVGRSYDVRMSGGIFLLNGERLVEMREQAYDSEARLQAWLASYPDLLAGDQFAGSPRRWLLVRREAGVPDQQGGGSRWSLDHLFIDHEAVPTLVEVKRSDDTRIRREVVGQMLDYAANGVVYWPAERLRGDFETRCAKEGKDPAAVFRDSLGDEPEADQFWDEVEQNLRSGRIRLVFVSDIIPPELRRVIEFLNVRMSPTEVIGVEVKQYIGQDNLTTFVPRVIGQTEEARSRKPASGTGEVDWAYYEAQLQPDRLALVRSLFGKIEKAAGERGLGWEPRLRSHYFSFLRPGGYACAGADIRRERPIDFWIKLPLSPEELRKLGRDVPDLYPELANRWDANGKQWRWQVPALEAIPDVTPAIELTRRYQPSAGPMLVPDMPGAG